MLGIESGAEVEGFTEYEEDILFDPDDPDFDNRVPAAVSVPFLFKVPATMSLATIHPLELHSSHSSLTVPASHSLDDTSDLCCWSPAISEQQMTIEELRTQLSSCFTCGVSWIQRHVSLDCSECGGYALDRPCPICDGTCGAIFKRDLTMSHASNKARWEGACAYSQRAKESSTNSGAIARELCTRLEKLSANS